jgi:uncharacterized protein YcbX
MPEITGLTIYPLTGARGVDVQEVGLTPAGFEGDRNFVLYQATDTDGVGERVSQKQFPVLARVDAELHPQSLFVSNSQIGELVVTRVTESTVAHVDVKPVTINEFGDKTPAYDCGDQAADYFSDLLGAPVRLAQKSVEWLKGESTQPEERRNAPIHFISDTAVKSIEARLQSTEDLASRFRANVRIGGFEPLGADELLTDETILSDRLNRWAGKLVVFGSGLMRLERLTPRCPVPSHDQRTGENRKDVARVYRDFPMVRSGDSHGRAFGVYGWPVAFAGVSLSGLTIGDVVKQRD